MAAAGWYVGVTAVPDTPAPPVRPRGSGRSVMGGPGGKMRPETMAAWTPPIAWCFVGDRAFVLWPTRSQRAVSTLPQPAIGDGQERISTTITAIQHGRLNMTVSAQCRR